MLESEAPPLLPKGEAQHVGDGRVEGYDHQHQKRCDEAETRRAVHCEPSPATLLRRGHICRGVGIAFRIRVCNAPQSETVKPRTGSPTKNFHGNSAISASDLPTPLP